jgi:nucleoside-diphosphate-sugar epimerase
MSKPSILVTGANGFVGRAVVARLGARARAVTRREVGEIGPDTDWSGALGDGIAAVIHCAARAHVLREEAGGDPLAAFRRVNRDGTLALARAAASAGVKRFVFVSSIGVNGAVTRGAPFRAGDPPRPVTDYAIAKHEAEQALAAVDIETVIVRPPLVIGAGAKGNIGALAKLMKRGLPLPFGAVRRNRRDLISVEVLADLLVLSADHPAAAGQVFLASDGVTRSTADIVRAVAKAEGVSARLLSVPPGLIGAGLGLIGRRAMRDQLLGDLEIDIGATRDRLGWTPHPPAA